MPTVILHDSYTKPGECRRPVTITGECLRGTQALWYAWGFVDSGAVPGLTLDHGWEFARAQEKVKADYDDGRSCFMPSLLSAWQAFLDEKGLARR